MKRALLFTAMHILPLSIEEDRADHTLKTIEVLKAEKSTFLFFQKTCSNEYYLGLKR